MIWHNSTVREVLEEFSVDPDKGLHSGIADQRLEQYGKNIIKKEKSISFLRCFLNQLNNKWVYILAAVALITMAICFAYKQEGAFTPLIMIAIIIFNSLVTAILRFRSDKALMKLNSVMTPISTVLRDGIEKQISSDEIVPGDIIILKQGDYVTADARLITTNNLRCNEYCISGESIPVDKRADEQFEDITPIVKRANIVYSGCSVVSGSAKAVVIETGKATEIGKNESITEEQGGEKLPIINTLDTADNMINIAVFVVCLIVFVTGVLKNIHLNSEPFASMTLKMLLNAVALGVAAIPESLPAISTIVVALGIQRMIKKNTVIKKTKALEILGKTNVICADKTGILTKDLMQLDSIFDGNDIVQLKKEIQPDNKTITILKFATCCSTLTDDSTEAAIEKACLDFGKQSKEDLGFVYPRLSLIPFDTKRKAMTTVNMINGRPVAITKGAPEYVIGRCGGIDTEKTIAIAKEMANRGLRVLCIALKQLDEAPAHPQAEEIENNLTFVGLLGLKDPPRSGAVEGIKICGDAGIKTVMVTGDSMTTASSIAKQIGILKNGEVCISGAELDEMSDEELSKSIENISVFARITPEHKQRIISIWQSKGCIVTATGDNIEDSDALSLADIGCTMGKKGTDVAKGNSDIVIEGNNFKALIDAIKESRGLFANIKKTIVYLLSCNLSELLFYLFGIIIFGVTPLTGVLLLLVNLLTDCAPAVSLATDNAEKSVMKKKPVTMAGKLFDTHTSLSIIFNGIFLTLIAFAAFIIGKSTDITTAYTMSFAVISISQILHLFNIKTEKTILKTDFKSNRFMLISTVIVLFVSMFLCVTPIGSVFGLTVLSTSKFLISIGLSLLIIPFSEILKLFFIKEGIN